MVTNSQARILMKLVNKEELLKTAAAKNRRGPTGIAELVFLDKWVTLSDVVKDKLL